MRSSDHSGEAPHLHPLRFDVLDDVLGLRRIPRRSSRGQAFQWWRRWTDPWPQFAEPELPDLVCFEQA
ncbi:MAG TPA: hypothetical protein VIY28_16205 [Pseudonocardiaceae bacterium]